jgi:hypothetical protein
MKKNFAIALLTTVCFCTLFPGMHTKAADTARPQSFEYATIRWGGRENTHVIRPSGRVEFPASQLETIKRPDRTDERSFYMNLVMNALAKEGYEFAGMDPDEIVMRRAVAR